MGGLFYAATSTCAIHIDIIAPDDRAAWYDLWQAAVALDGMCARKGRTGKSRFLGKLRRVIGVVSCVFIFLFFIFFCWGVLGGLVVCGGLWTIFCRG